MEDKDELLEKSMDVLSPKFETLLKIEKRLCTISQMKWKLRNRGSAADTKQLPSMIWP